MALKSLPRGVILLSHKTISILVIVQKNDIFAFL